MIVLMDPFLKLAHHRIGGALTQTEDERIDTKYGDYIIPFCSVTKPEIDKIA